MRLTIHTWIYFLPLLLLLLSQKLTSFPPQYMNLRRYWYMFEDGGGGWAF